MLEERECPVSTNPTMGKPFHGLLPRRRSNRRVSRRAPTRTTRLGGVASSCRGRDVSRDVQSVVHESSPILGLGLMASVTSRTVPGSTLTSCSSYRTSASESPCLVFRSSPSIDRTDLKYELFRR